MAKEAGRRKGMGREWWGGREREKMEEGGFLLF